jgi:hypothetical protein
LSLKSHYYFASNCSQGINQGAKKNIFNKKDLKKESKKGKEKKKAVTDNEIFHLILVSTETISSLMIAQIIQKYVNSY